MKAEQLFIQKRSDQAYGQYTPGFPDILLSDVGLVQLVQTTSGPASANRYMDATPTTIAPEQWEGHAFPASDQYALSAMAYQLLTGYPPFQGNTEQVRYDHLYTQPIAPSLRNPSLPPTLDPVILRALAKQPDARFPSILAFAAAFEQALQPAPPPLETGARAGNITITNAPAYAPPAPRRSGMSTTTAILLGVLALVLIAGIVGLLARNSSASNTDQLNATSTAQSANQEATARARAQNADATAQTKATASAQSQARATAQAQANATATANAQGEKQANATATAQANATATVLPATQLSGNWRNTASNTQGLTRLIISNNGLTMSVRAFAKCTTSPSGECDWGTRQGSFNGFPFVISFTHDNEGRN